MKTIAIAAFILVALAASFFLTRDYIMTIKIDGQEYTLALMDDPDYYFNLSKLKEQGYEMVDASLFNAAASQGKLSVGKPVYSTAPYTEDEWPKTERYDPLKHSVEKVIVGKKPPERRGSGHYVTMQMRLRAARASNPPVEPGYYLVKRPKKAS